MVTYNGETTNFSGQGSPNPNKLVIPAKDKMDPVDRAAMLAIEQWCNNLVSPAGASSFTISQTYSVQGTIAVASGSLNYLPPFFVPQCGSPGAIELVAVYTKLRAGSATLTIDRTGTPVATGVACSTLSTYTPIGATVFSDDLLVPVVTAASSADGLTCSFYLKLTP